MSTATVTPAYGRDYSSAKKAREAWEEGMDFILRDYASPWDGKPCNVTDLSTSSDYTHVNIRYGKLRKVTRVKL